MEQDGRGRREGGRRGYLSLRTKRSPSSWQQMAAKIRPAWTACHSRASASSAAAAFSRPGFCTDFLSVPNESTRPWMGGRVACGESGKRKAEGEMRVLSVEC